MRRDIGSLAIWLGVPVVMTAMLALAFGPGEVTPQGRLLVADEDGTFLSAMVARAFSLGELGKMIQVERVTAPNGRSRIGRGEASGFLLIPKGFAEAVLLGKPVRLTLLTNPAQRILPGIIEETLSLLVEAASYTQLLLGEQLRLIAEGPPLGAPVFSDRTISEISTSINRIFRSVGKYLDPPAIRIETRVIESQQPVGVGYAAAMLPGMLFMTVMFLGQGFASEIWKERLHGALRRLVITPGRLDGFIGGKMLAVAAVLVAVGGSALGLGVWVLGVGAAHWFLAMVWIVTSGLAMFLLLTLLQVHASTQRGASLLSSLVVFPLLMVGGSFFPFEMMPAGMARVGRLTPNGWALAGLRSILEGSPEPAALAVAFAVLVGVSAASYWLVLRRLRRSFVY